ncbi:hypothetical protein ACKKBG_A31510 [Auxenochlorella protothecoides x Auxenochlorella symbiontica]
MANMKWPFSIDFDCEDKMSRFSGTRTFILLLRSLAERAHSRLNGGVDEWNDKHLAPLELEAAEQLFDWKGGDIYVSRAPGRLDVMGGIADYSGSLVLQLPLRQACHVALQRQASAPGEGEPMLRIVSLGARDGQRACRFEMPMRLLGTTEQPLDLQAARALLTRDPATSWAAYVVGVVLVLAHEAPESSPLAGGAGLAVLIESDVPEGRGVSSSAAVEVAAMSALAAAFGATRLASDGAALALACQRAENRVVGAPCGVMDQMASALGREGALMALLCQPCQFQGTVEVPEHVSLIGISSGERHSVSGSDYGAVRTGAFMGLKLVQQACECRGQPQPRCLAQVSPEAWDAGLGAVCPAELSGAEFLRAHGEHLDDVTGVDPLETYAVRMPAEHAVREHGRVCEFARLLAAGPSEDQLERLGELMLASHASYGACGLGSPGTDRLVELVREERRRVARRGQRQVLHGAKITGGGSGGTVCVLASGGEEGVIAAGRVADLYRMERLGRGMESDFGAGIGNGVGGAPLTGKEQDGAAAPPTQCSILPEEARPGAAFLGSSNGALEFGVVRLRLPRAPSARRG